MSRKLTAGSKNLPFPCFQVMYNVLCYAFLAPSLIEPIMWSTMMQGR